MFKAFLAVMFLALGSSFALAGDDSDFAGAWSGKFEPSAFSGEMELTLTRDGDKWKAEAIFRSGTRKAQDPIRDLEIKGDQISFRTSIGGMEVFFSGKMDGGKLKGILEVSRDGNQVDTGTWVVSKKK